MKTYFLTMAFILAISIAAFAQDPPTAPADDEDVVKITTALIQVDVTVTDRKGDPIRDLKPGEIEIYENGKRQDISKFAFVSAGQTPTREAEAAAKKDRKDGAAEPILPPGRLRPENVRRTIALVVDDLTLSFASTAWVRNALKKFVNEQMQDGDLVAIIRTGGGVGALQQFTTDKRQLMAAIEKVRWSTRGRGSVGVFNPIEPSLAELSGANQRDLERMDEADREMNEFRENLFASGTLGALNFVIRGMRDLPGRKSIMLLSDGIPLISRDERGMPQSSFVLSMMRRLTDLANRASVVVYTMDARGLVFDGITAEDDLSGISAQGLERRLADRRNSLIDTQDGLRYLAVQTGGFPIINSNDISKGIRRVLDDQSYYLIGYEPDDSTFDPKTRRYNKLEIKVKREGARVRYRSGFFGVSDEAIQRPQMTASQALLNALTSPFAINDIAVNVSSIYTGEVNKTAYVRTFMHIDSNALVFKKDKDGTHLAEFDIVAMTFGDNGVVVDDLQKRFTINFTDEGYRQVKKSGLVYNFVMPIKKPGAYQMRIAVRDNDTNKVGSANQFIDVPNLRKNRLTLSGVVLETMPFERWQKLSAAGSAAAADSESPVSRAMADTSLRQFRRGNVLSYGMSVFNAKPNLGGGPSNLTMRVRIFRDGKPFYEGPHTPVPQQPAQGGGLSVSGALRLALEMAPGEYVLELAVTDALAKAKRNTAVQHVQFDIVE